MQTKSMSMACKCVLYIHITQLMAMLSSFPNIWVYPDGLCDFVGFVKYYSTYANVCSSFAIDIVLYGMLFHSSGAAFNSFSRINSYYWLELFVYGMPMMTVLPFSVGLYGALSLDGNTTCSLSPINDPDNWGKWIIAVYFSWCWALIILGVFQMIRIVVKVASASSGLAFQILPIFGIYPLFTLAFWIPRTIGRFSNSTDSTLGITAFAQGIGFFLIFIFFQSKFFKYEKDFAGNNNIDSEIFVESSGVDSGIWSRSTLGDMELNNVETSNPISALENDDNDV